MIIYSATKIQFLDDVLTSSIDEKLESSVKEHLGRSTPMNEVRSWRNSLQFMGNVINNPGIPDDSGIALEYNIPYTSKRVDMVISGYDGSDRYSAVIVELKQWEKAESAGKDGVVLTYINGGMHEVTHPSYQAWSYVEAIRDFNADVQDNDVILQPCAYLHNYALEDNDPIIGEEYADYIEKAPVFMKRDAKKLQDFIRRFIKRGDNLKTVFLIDGGRLRPSKSLQDCLSSMMEGNKEFTLLDSQKVVNETILSEARCINRGGKKKVIIVRGGPGTGKSVLAINLLNEIIGEGMSTAYVSKNAAPRNVYGQKLKGTVKKSRVDELFKGSGQFTGCPSDQFDVLLVDEAHRLNEKSGLFSNLGENQVMELIRSSKLTVFFIDEDQQVTLKDIGSVEEIRKHAANMKADVTEMQLDSQFRCSGSDGYLSWLDNTLRIRNTANITLEGAGYDFKVFDDPMELRKAIEEKNSANNKSRLVAGYCWNWISDKKDDSSVHDITIPEYGFGMSWNLGSTSTWAIDETSVNEVGCIHTCQGLEFDYVGVIIGNDLRFEDGKIVTDASKRAKTDQSLKGLGKMPALLREEKADRIIKNTYKVLMSRGMKGCYVYCCDNKLNAYFRKAIGKQKDRPD